MYNLLIIGYGYVGSAIAEAFKQHKVFIVDPKLKNKIDDYSDIKFDYIFVCVDTPKNEKFKTLNTVLREINNTFKNSIVICKSTALPNVYKKAQNTFKNINIIHYPEYLSHWNNINDFKNQKFCILGGESNICKKVGIFLKQNLTKLKDVKITSIEVAALLKYSSNCFYTLKITYANELYRIIKKYNIPCSFKRFAELFGVDERVGSTHLEVPGRDGKLGWGGHCFDKDTFAFANEYSSNLIKFIRKLNNLHRHNK
jgi:UDPglucose 6-dehydrogenase